MTYYNCLPLPEELELMIFKIHDKQVHKEKLNLCFSELTYKMSQLYECEYADMPNNIFNDYDANPITYIQFMNDESYNDPEWFCDGDICDNYDTLKNLINTWWAERDERGNRAEWNDCKENPLGKGEYNNINWYAKWARYYDI